LQSYALYLVCRAVLGSLAVLPRTAANWIVDRLATAAWLLDAHHRRIAGVNLAIAFPASTAAERERIGRRSFAASARNLVELGRLRRLTPERVRAIAEYDPRCGFDNYLAARRRGRSILYLTGHFSAWELLPAAHALYGHPLSFVTRPLDNPRLEEYLRAARQASGNTVISKKDSARRILEALRAGRDVGLLVDHNTSLQEGIYADLFGLPAATSSSLALLALRTEATVLPGYLTPMRDGKYWLKFLPPVELVRSGDLQADIAANTRIFNQVIETMIRDCPEAWLWGHKRWKNQPGAVDIYELTPEELDRYLRDSSRSQCFTPHQNISAGAE
jgi:KDO2-lipid IV(A) lauroyltransferase